MFYPPFDLPRLGGGMLIAGIAILHVVLAHGAVGGGIFTAIAAHQARRRGDAVLMRFVRHNARYLILVGFGLGAISGVGIWFSIGLAAPRATSNLIHSFVWAWAIEWVFFFVEIASGYVLYYGWDRLTTRQHQTVAWVYAGSAWMSLFIINAILSFMLSPNGQAVPGAFDFWTAFWNPTFVPSLLLRTVSSLALAGIFCCVAANMQRQFNRDERRHIINFGAWFLVPLGLMLPLAWWWFARVPAASRHLVFGGAVAMNLFFLFGLASSVLIAAYAYVGLIRLKHYVSLETSLLLAAMAFIATGAMEFVREGIRKPYVINGYLWSNGIADTPAEAAAINADGILAHAAWLTGPEGASRLRTLTPFARGEMVFAAQCAQCHVRHGPNDVGLLVATWRQQTIRTTLDELHERKPFMPPFVGTREEKDALADYLYDISHRQREVLEAGP